MSKWYETSPENQKLLLFIMAKSERQEYFVGGGMIEINMYTYGSVSYIRIRSNIVSNV